MDSREMKSLLLIVSSLSFVISTMAMVPSPPNSTISVSSHLTAVCKSTPYPAACFESLKLSLSLDILPNIFSLIMRTLNSALSEGAKLSTLLTTVHLVERQRGTVQDCRDLHAITMSALKKSVSRINTRDPRKLADARAYLSAALTNRVTCLEGLSSASGSMKPTVVNSIETTYAHVSNSLSMLPKSGTPGNENGNRRLLGLVETVPRRIMQDVEYKYDPSEVITVSPDGTGNFTTVTDAINFSPNNSLERTFIYVRVGVYEENVEIPSWKPNIVLLGDGADSTFITGSRSVADGWTTFRSATVAVSGEGFLARDLTFENTAGPENHQAVALRINADFAAVYKCTVTGFQDTLYVHSFRQFYRECDIYGTIDYVFGNAAVVLQGCNLISRMPLAGQFTVITAQSRESPDEDTGIAIQNCTILATEDLYSNSTSIRSYLGRPWRNYSRTVYLKSYIDDFIAPEGWSVWQGDRGLDTLYYGEYDNYGPGSATDGRVSWLGYHIMDYQDASNFTVSEFVTGQEWLDSTSFPYDDGV